MTCLVILPTPDCILQCCHGLSGHFHGKPIVLDTSHEVPELKGCHSGEGQQNGAFLTDGVGNQRLCLPAVMPCGEIRNTFAVASAGVYKMLHDPAGHCWN